MPEIIKATAENEAECSSRSAEILLNGGLVVLPTDTVYGLAANPSCPDACRRLYESKHRDQSKPVAFLASGVDAVRAAGLTMTAAEEAVARRFWPGPLMMILRAGNSLEGVRVPDHSLCRRIISEAGGLLRVTSANISGQAAACTAKEAIDALSGSVDLVVDGGRVPGGVASTVIRVDEGPRVSILREGPISAVDLEKAICG
jgi:L-threonylcarbamoyladenylate synthase